MKDVRRASLISEIYSEHHNVSLAGKRLQQQPGGCGGGGGGDSTEDCDLSLQGRIEWSHLTCIRTYGSINFIPTSFF